VLNEPIALAESEQSVALGAAILGCLAAGSTVSGHPNLPQAIHAMARQRSDLTFRPDATSSRQYQTLYRLYRKLGDCEGATANVMRELRGVG